MFDLNSFRQLLFCLLLLFSSAIDSSAQSAAAPKVEFYVVVPSNRLASCFLQVYGLPLAFKAPASENVQRQIEQATGLKFDEFNSEASPDTGVDDQGDDSEEVTSPPSRQTRVKPTSSVWHVTATVRTPLASQGLLTAGKVDTQSLVPTLKQIGAKEMEVFISLPNTRYVECSPGEIDHRMEDPKQTARSRYPVTYSAIVPTSALVQFQYRFGYRTQDLLGVAIPMLIAFLAPIGFTLWTRRITLNATGVEPEALWFGYWRYQQRISRGFWLVWLTINYASGTVRVVQDVFGLSDGLVRGIGWLVVNLVPVGLVTVICAGLSQPVHEKVRGLDKSRSLLVEEAFWGYVARVLPYNIMISGLYAGSSSTVVWIVAGMAIGKYATARLVKLQDAPPFVLTQGELRDRILELAKKANVNIQYVLIMPTAKSQTANAFAASGNIVMLTDYLLEKLSRREVDVVIAHELTHLQRKHPGKMQALYWAMFIGIMIGSSILQFTHIAIFQKIPVFNLSLWLVGMPIYYAISRRFEFQADSGAAYLTSDPEAVISGLAAINHLNFMPLKMGRLDEMTHPSTVRRAEAIAKHWKVPSERMEILLHEAGAGAHYSPNGTVAMPGPPPLQSTNESPIAAAPPLPQAEAGYTVPTSAPERTCFIRFTPGSHLSCEGSLPISSQ